MSDEQVAAEGLNIVDYHFKWKKAQELANSSELSAEHLILPYWERVRLLFLELGGEKTEPAKETGK